MRRTSSLASARVALLDTGPLVALFVRGDPDHRHVTAFFKRYNGRLLTTWPVLVEVCHFLEPAVAVKFLRWIDQGAATVVEVPTDELPAIASLMERYADRPMDLADATLVWASGQLGVDAVLTLDRGDFQTYRTAAGNPFRDLLAD